MSVPFPTPEGPQKTTGFGNSVEDMASVVQMRNNFCEWFPITMAFYDRNGVSTMPIAILSASLFVT